MKQLKEYIIETSSEIKHETGRGGGRFYCNKGDLIYTDEIEIYPVFHKDCFELTNLESFEKNKGIGTKLLNKMIEYAKSEKKDIVLYASPLDDKNEDDLIKFYKKFGFIEYTKANDKHCLIYKCSE